MLRLSVSTYDLECLLYNVMTVDHMCSVSDVAYYLGPHVF